MANTILQGMFDTACEAVREPSFNAYDWDGVFDLFHDVIKLRMDLTPHVKKHLRAHDHGIHACIWQVTIPTLIAV